MNKKQLSNVLGAGTITGFVLALMMLLSNGDVVKGETAVSPTTTSPGITEVVPIENYNQLQAQNDQLIQDLQTMQDREQQYEAQITAANQLAAQPTFRFSEEHEEHEEHEHHDD